MNRADVITKLAAAERGSMDLTADVYEALGHRVKRSLVGRTDRGRTWVYQYDGGYGRRWYAMERLTESVDAALRLLPMGAWFLIAAGKTRPDEPLYGAQIRRPKIDADAVIAEGESDVSLAIAVCIAALKAAE